jgi:hypothetical protein
MRLEGTKMGCKQCSSENQADFPAELCVHFPGLNDLSQPAVFVFSVLLVCMQCGRAEFALPEEELRQLTKTATRLARRA